MLKIKVITSRGIKKWNYNDVVSIMDCYSDNIFDVIEQYHKRRAFMKYLKALCRGGIADWDLYALLTYHWKHIFKKIGLHSTAMGMVEYLIEKERTN